MKANTTISIDSKLKELARLKNLNISRISEDAIKKALKIELDPDKKIEKKIEKERDLALEEFLEKTSPSVLDHAQGLSYWSFRTGKPVEELVELKRKHTEEHPKGIAGFLKRR